MKKIVHSKTESKYRLREVQTNMFVGYTDLTLFNEEDSFLPWFDEEKIKYMLKKIEDEKPTWEIEITKQTKEIKFYEEPIDRSEFMEDSL